MITNTVATGIHQVESTTLVNNASTQGDKFPVDVSTGVIDYTGHGTSEHHSVSAKLPSVAQDQWVLRFEHTVDSTISTSNGDVNVFVGIADDPTKHFQEDQDWIGSRLMLSAHNGAVSGLIRPNSADNAAPQAGQCNNYYGYMGSGTENTKYYLELVRDGSDYDFSISNGNEYDGDVLNVDNCSVNGTPENLQYIKFGSSAGSSATHPWDGTIENVQFWDGTITASGDGSIAWQAPLFDSNNISAGGGTYQRTFDTAGTYNYECPLHSGMTGQVVVADSYSLPSGTEDFTVSTWTKTTQAPATVVYNEDYSGTNTYLEQDTGHFWWDSTNNRISFDTIRMSNINMSHELDTALSDKWIMRGTFEASALPNSWSSSIYVGMSNDDSSGSFGGSNSSSDTVMFYINPDNSKLYLLWSDDQAPYANNVSGAYNLNLNTQYWYELIRNGSDISIEIFNDSGFSQSNQVLTLAMTGTPTELKYVEFGGTDDSGVSGEQAGSTGWFDDTQICNGHVDWANCSTTGTDEIGTVLSFETKEADTTSTTSYNAGVTWDSATAVNININGNTVDTTNAGWSNYAQSTQTDITSGTIEITGNFYSDGRGMIGFGKDALGDNTTIDYSCYGNGSEWIAYESGTVADTMTSSYSSSDVCKIEIESDGTVNYYVNDSLEHTSSGASGEYYVQAVLNKFSGGTTPSASVDLEYDSVTVTTYPVKTTAFEIEPTKMRIVDIVPAENNVSFTDNFDSDNWTHQDSSVTSVTGGVLDYRMQAADSSVDNAWVDLGSALPEQWVLRWEATYDAYPQSGNGHNHGIAMAITMAFAMAMRIAWALSFPMAMTTAMAKALPRNPNCWRENLYF